MRLHVHRGKKGQHAVDLGRELRAFVYSLRRIPPLLTQKARRTLSVFGPNLFFASGSRNKSHDFLEATRLYSWRECLGLNVRKLRDRLRVDFAFGRFL